MGGGQPGRQGDRDERKKGRGEECKREEDVEQENRVEYLLECVLANEKRNTMLLILPSSTFAFLLVLGDVMMSLSNEFHY